MYITGMLSIGFLYSLFIYLEVFNSKNKSLDKNYEIDDHKKKKHELELVWLEEEAKKMKLENEKLELELEK